MASLSARHRVVLLALLVNLVCYTDRASISIAGPEIRREYGLSPAEMGLVYSIFSLSYFLGQTPWGMAADRWGARGLVAVAILGWSAFTGLTAVAAGFASLLAVRFAFGGLEAALSPAVASAFRRWIPERERASAFGFYLGGGRLGGAVTPFLAVPLMTAWGWRAVFVAFAAFGLVAAAVWWAGYRDAPPPARDASATAAPERITPWREILASPRLWRLLAVAFGCTFLWQFYITWFPTYLREQRGLGLAESARYAGLPFLLGMAATWSGGLLTDALARRRGIQAARTWVGTLSLGSAGLLLSAGLWCEDARLAAVLMACAAAGVDLFLGAAWASALDIGGSNGGAVAGLMNAASNCAGFVSPAFTGWVLERFHSWNLFLGIAVAVDLVAAVIWLGVNPRGDRLRHPQP